MHSPRRRWWLVLGVLVLALIAVGLLGRRQIGKNAPGTTVAADRAQAAKGTQPRIVGAVDDSREQRRSRASRLSGHVRTPTGSAIANAMVCASGYADDLADDDLGQPTCAFSRSDGAYAIVGLPAAHYQVDATAAGHRPGRYRADKRESVDLLTGESKEGIDLVLGAGGVAVKGRVRDIGGGAVPSALITIASGFWGGWELPVARGQADERGEFELFVAPGEIQVTASAPGYTSGDASSIAPGAFVEVLLTPEATLIGRVVRKGTDEPVANAIVYASPSAQFEWQSNRSATTDGDGKFRIDRLAPGRYKPQAESTDGVGQAATSVLLGVGGQSSSVLIELHPAAVVSGRVFLADGKTPCARGYVRMTDRKSELAEGATVGREGDFAMRGVLPGRYNADVRCEGHPDLVVAQPIEVQGKYLTGLRFVLERGRRVRGSVVRADGSGVADANVILKTTGGRPRDQQRHVFGQTKPDGTFAIEGVMPGSYDLDVGVADEPTPLEPVAVTVPAGTDVDGVRVVLSRAITLTGSVRDEDGQAVKGATVYATGEEERWGGGQTVSRDDGTFTLRGLRAGNYRVTAARKQDWLRAPGQSDDDVGGKKITVVAGANRPVHLVVERERGTIRGQVVQAGANVTDAFVDAQRESESAATTAGSARRDLRGGWGRTPALTDVDGRFEVKDLSPGRYTIRAYRKGGGEAVVEKVEVGAFVTLTIAATTTLAGTVKLPAGGAPDSFTISMDDAKEGVSTRERFWRTNGAWRITDHPAGNYKVSASAPEGTASANVSLTEGQQRTDVVLDLVSKTQIRGRIVALDDGAPIAGMVVQVVAKGMAATFRMGDNSSQRRHVTDAEGRFEIDDAATGKTTVYAIPEDWEKGPCQWVRMRATIPAGPSADIGTLRCVRRLVKPPARPGDLGYQLKEREPDPEEPPQIFTVAVVRPDGPAVGSGLKVGDVIVSVNGRDVTGDNDHLYYGLTAVPFGATLKLGLKGGTTVEIKAARPL